MINPAVIMQKWGSCAWLQVRALKSRGDHAVLVIPKLA
jgi:hypothetical protein